MFSKRSSSDRRGWLDRMICEYLFIDPDNKHLVYINQGLVVFVMTNEQGAPCHLSMQKGDCIRILCWYI